MIKNDTDPPFSQQCLSCLTSNAPARLLGQIPLSHATYPTLVYYFSRYACHILKIGLPGLQTTLISLPNWVIDALLHFLSSVLGVVGSHVLISPIGHVDLLYRVFLHLMPWLDATSAAILLCSGSYPIIAPGKIAVWQLLLAHLACLSPAQ